MLDAVVADGHAAVIRGAPGPFYPRDCAPAFRLLQPQAGLASAKTGARISQERIRTQKLEPDEEHRYAVTWLPTFVDHPRCWTILDIDRVRALSVSDVGEATLERSAPSATYSSMPMISCPIWRSARATAWRCSSRSTKVDER